MTRVSKWKNRFCLALLTLVSAAGAARTPQQIQADLDLAAAKIEAVEVSNPPSVANYSPEDFKRQALVMIARERINLLQELEQANPSEKGYVQYAIDGCWARLAAAGDAEAGRSLEQASASPDKDAAHSASLAMAMRDWWADRNSQSQKKILDRLTAEAKSRPADDLLAYTLVTVAAQGPASEELAIAARRVVVRELKGRWARRYVATPNKVGWPMAISGMTPDGKPFSTASWTGKVVLVDFWAVWCPYCRNELPEMIAAYKKYHDQGLEIIGIDNDFQKSELLQYARQFPDMTWPQIFGPSSSPKHYHPLTEQCRAPIPAIYLIDRNGVLRTDAARFHLDEWVPKLLEEKADPRKAALLAELIDSPPHPAVSDTPAPAAPMSTAAKPPAPAPPPTITAPPSPADNAAVAKQPPVADDAAQKASRALNLAKSYIAAGRYDVARTKLESILTTYPGSAAAKEAESLLRQIAGK